MAGATLLNFSSIIQNYYLPATRQMLSQRVLSQLLFEPVVPKTKFALRAERLTRKIAASVEGLYRAIHEKELEMARVLGFTVEGEYISLPAGHLLALVT